MLHNELTKCLPNTMPSTIFRNLVILVVRDVELVLWSIAHPHTFSWSCSFDRYNLVVLLIKSRESQDVKRTWWSLFVCQILLVEFELGEISEWCSRTPNNALSPDTRFKCLVQRSGKVRLRRRSRHHRLVFIGFKDDLVFPIRK